MSGHTPWGEIKHKSMKTHLILEAKRERWLKRHRWWVRVVGHEFYVFGASDYELDKAVKRVLKHVRLYGQLPKYARITWEYAPCGGDGCTGCASCWSANDAAMEVLVPDRAAHEARVAELIDRNKGFLTP